MDKLNVTIGILGALSALFGAIVGAVAGLGSTWIKERYETKRKIKELAVKSATEDWSRMHELCMKEGSKDLAPFDSYVVHYLLVLEYIFSNKDFNIEDFRKVLEKSELITKEYFKRSPRLKKELRQVIDGST